MLTTDTQESNNLGEPVTCKGAGIPEALKLLPIPWCPGLAVAARLAVGGASVASEGTQALLPKGLQGEGQGFPRAAAPVGVFSRGTTRISLGPQIRTLRS